MVWGRLRIPVGNSGWLTLFFPPLSSLNPPQICKSYCTEVQSANISNWNKLVYTFNFLRNHEMHVGFFVRSGCVPMVQTSVLSSIHAGHPPRLKTSANVVRSPRIRIEKAVGTSRRTLREKQTKKPSLLYARISGAPCAGRPWTCTSLNRSHLRWVLLHSPQVDVRNSPTSISKKDSS